MLHLMWLIIFLLCTSASVLTSHSFSSTYSVDENEITFEYEPVSWPKPPNFPI